MFIFITIVIILLLYLILLFPRISKRTVMGHFAQTMFAHRGYHCIDHGIPENSMAAFYAAIKNGYGIELDVHLTKDNKLVVFHDNTLTRMCDAPRVVEELTYEELKRYPLLHTSEHIPLFTDVLALVNGQVPLLIELKIPTKSIKICSAVYEKLDHYNGDYLVQSFNTMGLRWFRLHAPEILRGQLSSNLLKSHSAEPFLLKCFVKSLFANVLGRPDFISYKLSDLPTLNVWILRTFFGTPVAVWTLRTNDALYQGRRKYDMQIFEKQSENY